MSETIYNIGTDMDRFPEIIAESGIEVGRIWTSEIDGRIVAHLSEIKTGKAISVLAQLFVLYESILKSIGIQNYIFWVEQGNNPMLRIIDKFPGHFTKIATGDVIWYQAEIM